MLELYSTQDKCAVLIIDTGLVPIKHVPNKNSNTEGSSCNVVKVIFHTLRNCS